MLKIAKASVLLLTLTLFSFKAFGQDRFRVESFSLSTGEQVEFVLPPKSKLKVERGDVVSKYQYHFVRVSNLSGDYPKQVAALNESKYYYSRHIEGKDEEVAFDTAVKGCAACMIGYLPADKGAKKEGFVLRIDYSHFLAILKSEDVVNAFGDMAVALLNHFSLEESSNGWPVTLSQNIVGKVFELLPVPQRASLLRYGVNIGDKGTFILLNPGIVLKVDDVSIVRPGTGGFHYQLSGETIIRTYRDSRGNIKQLPFIDYDKQTLPNNVMPDFGVLQASSGDIQLSESLKGKPYIALYQKTFKRNNSNANDGSCRRVEEMQGSKCNSMLLHAAKLGAFLDASAPDRVKIDLDNLATLLDAFSLRDDGTMPCEDTKDCAKRAENIVRSYFGTRSLITPLITVHLNGYPTLLDLNTTLFEFSSRYSLPAKLVFSRLRNGKYHRFKQLSAGTVLLPGDRISF